MIVDIPAYIEERIIATAQAQGVSTQELVLTTLQYHFAPNDDEAYYAWFHEHHYDIEHMDKMLGETDEHGDVKNGKEVPS